VKRKKNSDGDQPDLFRSSSAGGRGGRDEGIKRVLSHNEQWLACCVASVRRLRWTVDFVGEDIRFHCVKTCGHPKHHNAWGGLINSLLAQKIIYKTGEHRQMKDPISHARETPLYRLTLYETTSP